MNSRASNFCFIGQPTSPHIDYILGEKLEMAGDQVSRIGKSLKWHLLHSERGMRTPTRTWEGIEMYDTLDSSKDPLCLATRKAAIEGISNSIADNTDK